MMGGFGQSPLGGEWTFAWGCELGTVVHGFGFRSTELLVEKGGLHGDVNSALVAVDGFGFRSTELLIEKGGLHGDVNSALVAVDGFGYSPLVDGGLTGDANCG